MKRYDFVIYDIAPSAGIMERAIIRSVDEVITPLSPKFFQPEGIFIFNKFLQDIRDGYEAHKKYSHIAINKINKTYTRHGQFTKRIEEFPGFSFSHIPQDTEIGKVQAQGIPLHEYNQNNIRSLPTFKVIAERIIEYGQ